MSERDAPRAYRLAVAFALDLAVAFALGVVAFMLCGFAWAATHAGVQGPEGMHRLSMPGPLAEVLSTVQVVATAGAAQSNPSRPASPVRVRADRQSYRAVACMRRSRRS